jgi:hypothetical protein
MSSIFQVAGMVAIVAGTLMLSIPVGLIVAGALFIVVGLSVVR